MTSGPPDSGFPVASLLGAAGGAVAISLVTERYAIRRQSAALGGAAVAFTMSQATSGSVRAFFQGATLAGLGLAVAELARALRQDHGRATPAILVGVTPSVEVELTEAAAPGHAPSAQDGQPRIRSMELPNRSPTEVTVAATTVNHRAADSSSAAASGGVHDVDVPAIVTPEAIAHLSKVYRRLDENERRTFSTMNATGVPETVAAQRAELLRRSPAEAVAYLRRFVLRTNDASLTSDSISRVRDDHASGGVPAAAEGERAVISPRRRAG